ncbi:MAG: hypothetical protein QXQ50_06185 [Candidatus Bathyarchaeia archaeon]
MDDNNFFVFLYRVNIIYGELSVDKFSDHIQRLSRSGIINWTNIPENVRDYISNKCQAGDPAILTVTFLKHAHLHLFKNYLAASTMGCLSILRLMLETTSICGYIAFDSTTSTAEDYCKEFFTNFADARFPIIFTQEAIEDVVRNTMVPIWDKFFTTLSLASKWKKNFRDMLNAIEYGEEALSKVGLDKRYLNELYDEISKRLHSTFGSLADIFKSSDEELLGLPSVDLDSLKYTREYIIKVLDAILCFILSMKCRYWGYEDVKDYIRALELEKYQIILRNLEYAKPGQRLEKFTNLFHSARNK